MNQWQMYKSKIQGRQTHSNNNKAKEFPIEETVIHYITFNILTIEYKNINVHEVSPTEILEIACGK